MAVTTVIIEAVGVCLSQAAAMRALRVPTWLNVVPTYLAPTLKISKCSFFVYCLEARTVTGWGGAFFVFFLFFVVVFNGQCFCLAKCTMMTALL